MNVSTIFGNGVSITDFLFFQARDHLDDNDLLLLKTVPSALNMVNINEVGIASFGSNQEAVIMDFIHHSLIEYERQQKLNLLIGKESEDIQRPSAIRSLRIVVVNELSYQLAIDSNEFIITIGHLQTSYADMAQRARSNHAYSSLANSLERRINELKLVLFIYVCFTQ